MEQVIGFPVLFGRANQLNIFLRNPETRFSILLERTAIVLAQISTATGNICLKCFGPLVLNKYVRGIDRDRVKQ